MNVYLGSWLAADQGSNHFPLFPTLVQKAGRVRNILEVGSWAGGSLIAWGKAAPHAELTAIDAWAPYMPNGPWPHYPVMNAAAASGAIQELFRSNIRAAGMWHRVTILKGDSRARLAELRPDMFDIVFLDGDHRYRVIHDDIHLAKRLVRDGGILCGDDLDEDIEHLDPAEHDRLVKTVDEEVAQLASGRWYHHGVVQAVAEHFEDWTCYESRLWAVRRVGERWEAV